MHCPDIQQMLCYSENLSPDRVQKIVNAYATCAAKFEETYLNEMGRQGWEMVNTRKLEAEFPDDLGCQGVTVGYGFEVAWKQVK